MKIFCIGRNYVEHAKELQNEIPSEPVIFIKPRTAYLHHSQPFYYPPFTNELHYEAELVLRVCKNGRYIREKFANQYYNEITVGIDFTARDIQQKLKEKGLPWEKAKAWDGSALVGDFIDLDENFVNQPIPFSLRMNDDIVQEADSSLMIFSFNKIIADISQYFSLNIGDLIFTGTPKGVGECVVGDELEGFIDDTSVFKMTIK